MLGLHHQVDRGQLDRRLRPGDDHHLGRTGDPGGDTDHARHLALGLGDVAVARPDDHVDRLDRLGAVGQGRDGLGTPDPVHLVHPGHPGCGQRRVVDPTVGGRRCAEHHFPHACDSGGGGAHQHGRGVAGPPSRRVAARTGDRSGQVLHRDPPVRELLDLGSHLVRVVGADPVVRHLDRLAQLGGDPIERAVELGVGHPELVELDPVEGSGQAAERGVTTGPHRLDDRRDLAHRTIGLAPRPRQRGTQRGRIIGDAAKVQVTQRHSPSMLVEGHATPSGQSGRSGPTRSAAPGHDMIGPMSAAELSSLATALDELTRRVTEHAESADARKDEETARELFAIERALNGANRRLSRLATALSRR